MKKLLLGICILLSGFWAKAVDVTIVESQSGNFWATQDSVWYMVATSLGFNATIVPQSALDFISNLASTDVLIVSSATIMYTGTNHYQTIEQYVLSGRPAYIQSEYSGIYQGNITFDSLMQRFGVNFSWSNSITGNLIPMNVSGILSTTPNQVDTLNYFNAGYSGITTDPNLEAFLEFNGEFYGFCYSGTAAKSATIITISDEDWAWHNASPELMENILFRLANVSTSVRGNNYPPHTSLSVFPNPMQYSSTFVFPKELKNAALSIFNSAGTLMMNVKNISADLYQFENLNWPAGIYSVCVQEDSGERYTTKMILLQE